MERLKKKLKNLALCFLCSLCVLVVWVNRNAHERKTKIVIGGINTTECHLFGELLAQLIEEKTDYLVARRFHLGSTMVCFQALRADDIDIYFEYTGTILFDILKETHVSSNKYAYLEKELSHRFGVTLLNGLGVSNKWAIIVRADSGLRTISDFAEKNGTKMAHFPEFLARKEAKILQNNYPREGGWGGLMMEQALMYVSLLNGAVDGITGGVTDGWIIDPRLTVLEDDLGCFPEYEVVPLISIRSLKRYPEIKELCSLLVSSITEEELRQYNYRVEFEKADIKSVAREVLTKRGII